MLARRREVRRDRGSARHLLEGPSRPGLGGPHGAWPQAWAQEVRSLTRGQSPRGHFRMPGLERDGRPDTKGHRSGRWQVTAWGVLVGPGSDPDDAARLLPTSLGLGGLWVCGLRGGMVWGFCRPAWPMSSSSSSTWWRPSGPSSSKPLATRPCSISADRRRLLDTLHLHTHAGARLEASRACRAGVGGSPSGRPGAPGDQ